jgi:hypothetical protein
MRRLREDWQLGNRFACATTCTGALAVALLLAMPSAARADAVMLWNNTLLSIIPQTSGLLTSGPPEVAREIAMVDTAMYDAVNAVTGEKYKPYAFAAGPIPDASADAAALQAGFTVMLSIFSNPVWGAPVSAEIVPQILQAYIKGLLELNAGVDTAKGIAVGAAAGNAMVTLRANDGSTAAILNDLPPNPPFNPPGSGTVPGVYIPPTRPAMFPTWGTVTPFTMTSSSQFPVPPAPDVKSADYAASILETECVGAGVSLSEKIQGACDKASGGNNFGLPKTAGKVDSPSGPTASSEQLALFWNDPGTTLAPPGHWLAIAGAVLTDQGVTDELQEARLGAMIGTAEADAGIAAWYTKYLPFPTGTLWRPINAIQDCDIWNDSFTTCDPHWDSVIATPPHPDYLAGHPTFSTAAATVLDAFFGTDNIPFCSTSLEYLNAGVTVEPIRLCYDGFLAAAEDATISRIYGGIHTTFSVFNGVTLGAEIADQLVANDFTLIVAEPSSFAVLGVGLAGLLHWRKRPRNGTAASSRAGYHAATLLLSMPIKRSVLATVAGSLGKATASTPPFARTTRAGSSTP